MHNHIRKHWIIFVLGILCLVLVGRFYYLSGSFLWFIQFNQQDIEWDELASRAQFFGDFTGPILNFAALICLLYTIILQRKDIESTNKQQKEQETLIRHQSIEASFFRMLSIHNDIVNAIDIQYRDGRQSKGRDCFKFLFKDLQGRVQSSRKLYSKGIEIEYEEEFKIFWNERRQDLGHYFRFLYNIIKFIDGSFNDNEEYEKKEKYIKILRAQLSDYELALLLITSFGPYGNKFLKYMKNFDLLDNMPGDLFIISHHKDRAISEKIWRENNNI